MSHSLKSTLYELGTVAVVHGGKHYITISTATGATVQGEENDNAVLIFSPPLGSVMGAKATLHPFPSIHDAATYISKTFRPIEELTAYHLIPNPPANNAYDAILPIYEGNLRLLEMTMRLGDMNSDVNSDQRNIANMSRSLVAEENKTNDAQMSAEALQLEIEEVERELKGVQDLTNALLYDQSQKAYVMHADQWQEPGKSKNKQMVRLLMNLLNIFDRRAIDVANPLA